MSFLFHTPYHTTTMLRFAVIGHKAVTTPDFSLNDMPGGAGRMDVLCRCINASFFLSHDLRRNTECFLILKGGEQADPANTVTLRFSGEKIKSLNPDERSAGGTDQKSTRNHPGRRISAGGTRHLHQKKRPLHTSSGTSLRRPRRKRRGYQNRRDPAGEFHIERSSELHRRGEWN